MATDKDKLIKGIRYMAIAFPFIFLGPGLLFLAGIPALRDDNIIWLVISILLMGVAGFLSVKGLRTILSSFFDGTKPPA